MVIFGGLEIVAAGYLLNEFNKEKVEARDKRKHDRPHDHNRPHSRPPRDDGPSRPSADYLAPPNNPPRPSSAPPINAGPGNTGPWQQRPPQFAPQPQYPGPQGPYQGPYQGPPQPTGPPGSPYPFQTHLQNLNQPQSQQYPQNFPHDQRMGQGPPPFGPGGMQHASTFQQQQQAPHPQQFMQSSQTFPAGGLQQSQRPPFRPSQSSGPPPQQQPVKPATQAPPMYIDTKTGKVSHNLYPADHPMARGGHEARREMSRDLWGDQKYTRSLAGDIDTGMAWERDQNDLAYGKDYSSDGRSDPSRLGSFERTRNRGRSSPPPRH